MQRAFSIVRHRVYSRALNDLPASASLPDGLTLRAVNYEDCVRHTWWTHSGAEWYREWHRAGAQCWLGWQTDEPVFKAWVARAPRLITSVVPWAMATPQPAYIFDVETRGSHRRKGLGKAFLPELMDERSGLQKLAS